MPRQKPTNPDIPDWTLTPQQETAVDFLVSGMTVTDTAAAVEVTRQTVSEWLNHHPGPSLRCIGTFRHGSPVLTAFPSRKGSQYIDT
jgi:hypothetical protein